MDVKFVIMIVMNFKNGNDGNMISIVNLVILIMILCIFYGEKGCKKILVVNLIVGDKYIMVEM